MTPVNPPIYVRAGALSALLLSGSCSQIEGWRHPEIAVCEEYIGGTLKSPATYKRAKVTIADNKLPLEYWKEATDEIFGEKSSKDTKTMFDEINKDRGSNGGVRTVLVEYDAANGFGVPIRGLAACKFEMKSLADNEFSTKPSATNALATRAAAAVGVGEESEIPCCDSKRTMDRLNRYQAKEQYVSQQVFY